MSNYHISTVSGDGNTFSVVAHFPVANTDNDVGTNYRTALIESLGGSQPSAVPFIEVAEQTQLDAGELLERAYSFNTYPGEALLDKRDRLDTLWEVKRTESLQKFSFQLSYWGFSRDVP